MRQEFSAEDDAAIIAGYRIHRLQDIAVQLGRLPNSVQSRARILVTRGLVAPTQRAYQPIWTETQVQELRGRWGWDPPSVVARAVGRSVVACKVKAKRLGIPAHGRYAIYSASQVGVIFSVDVKTVVGWIQKGWLVGRQHETGAGPNKRWHIHYDAIEAFIREHPAQYGRQRLAPGTWWRELADRTWRDRETVSIEQAARILGVRPSTLARHCQRGWLPAEREPWSGGFAWRIPRAALAGFTYRHPPGLYGKGRRGAIKREQRAVA